jgi:hypothetical protein
MAIKSTKQLTLPFLFAARNFAPTTHTEHLVLFYLISRLKEGTCYPKQALIAYELGFTEHAIIDNLATLEKKGVVTIEKQGKHNVYRVNLKAIEEHQRPPMPETPEYVEPPTTKNLRIGQTRLGRAPIEEQEQVKGGSPIEDQSQKEQVNPPSLVIGTSEPAFTLTGEPSFIVRGQDKRTFKNKEDIKSSEACFLDSPECHPDNPNGVTPDEGCQQPASVSKWCPECDGELVEPPADHICPHCQCLLTGVMSRPRTQSEGYIHMAGVLEAMEECERKKFYRGPLTPTQREWITNCEGAGSDGYYARELKHSDEEAKTAALFKRCGVETDDSVEVAQPVVKQPVKKQKRGSSAAIAGITKPCMDLIEARRRVQECQDETPDVVVCTSCWRIHEFHFEEKRCKCGAETWMPAERYLAQLEAQWRVYNAQVRASAGISLKEIVGRLDLNGMGQQPRIIDWLNANQIELMPVRQRRSVAKELYDTQSQEQVRIAWYLFASGLLDGGEETEPRDQKLFDDLGALEPRIGVAQ